jgi:hypothetical protein
MDETSVLYKVAPNVGANNRLIDLMFFLEPKSKDISLSSALTLENRIPVQAARYSNEGEKHQVTLKAEIHSH